MIRFLLSLDDFMTLKVFLSFNATIVHFLHKFDSSSLGTGLHWWYLSYVKCQTIFAATFQTTWWHCWRLKNKFSFSKKTFFITLIVTNLSLQIGFNTSKSIHSKTTAMHEIRSSTRKIELMRFIGSMNFYSEITDEYRNNLKPMNDLFHDKGYISLEYRTR